MSTFFSICLLYLYTDIKISECYPTSKMSTFICLCVYFIPKIVFSLLSVCLLYSKDVYTFLSVCLLYSRNVYTFLSMCLLYLYIIINECPSSRLRIIMSIIIFFMCTFFVSILDRNFCAHFLCPYLIEISVHIYFVHT